LLLYTVRLASVLKVDRPNAGSPKRVERPGDPAADSCQRLARQGSPCRAVPALPGYGLGNQEIASAAGWCDEAIRAGHSPILVAKKQRCPEHSQIHVDHSQRSDSNCDTAWLTKIWASAMYSAAEESSPYALDFKEIKMKFFKLLLLLIVGVSISLAASAQKFRDNPEQVLSDEFGWTIKDLTRLSSDAGGLFSSRKEPFQGFKCAADSRYLPKTDEQKKAWRIGSSVCRTSDRKRNENIGAYLVINWGNLGVEKPPTVEDFIDERGKQMSGDAAKE
jgi:hypothetical protein